jgi:hypothetical protein
MTLQRLQEIQQGIARLTEFMRQVDQSSERDALHARIPEHLALLDSLPGVLKALLVGEGKQQLLIRSPDDEIRRVPIGATNEFSCVPIFIIGHRRSGTTLLACLLNSANGLVALPEAFIAGHLVRTDHLFRIGHFAMKQLGDSYPRYLSRLGHLVDAVHSQYAARKGKRRWVSKELFVPHRLDLLDAVFDYRAQFIYIVRHGLSVAYSCASKFPMRDGLPLNDRSSLDVETYLDEWLQNTNSTMDFHERNQDRCLLVRYEEFTADPTAVGARLFDFIDEPWTDALLETGLAEQDPFGFGDKNILTTGGKVHRAEEPWRTWPKALLRTLGRKANPTLERMGYELVG